MRRYIDANLIEYHEEYDGQGFTRSAYADDIENLPAANVRENIRGEWITANEQPYFRKHYNNVVCSVCHKKGDSRWNFCPSCGADMRKEE